MKKTIFLLFAFSVIVVTAIVLVSLKNTSHRILVMWEPPSVILDMYQEDVLKLFDKVYTWNDDLVDGKKFFKLHSFLKSDQAQYFTSSNFVKKMIDAIDN